MIGPHAERLPLKSAPMAIPITTIQKALATWARVRCSNFSQKMHTRIDAPCDGFMDVGARFMRPFVPYFLIEGYVTLSLLMGA